MTISIRNLGNDSHSGPLRSVSVNVIRATINGVPYDLPQIVPNKAELDNAEFVRQSLNNTIFEYVYKPRDLGSLRNPTTVRSITNRYRGYINRYGPVSDFYVQVAQDNQIPNALRNTIHQIQFDAGSSIISDYEPDRNQTVNAFANQITTSQSRYPNNDISPTLDIGTRLPNRFSEKLQWAIDNKFKRINVIYRAINATNIRNWLALSRTIHKQNVWINVIGVLPRYHVTTHVSTISSVFLFGVHTVSLGHAWVPTPNANSYVFNPQTHRFNLATGVDYSQSRRTSVELMAQDLVTARNHILQGTYFAHYITQRQGLLQSLNSIT